MIPTLLLVLACTDVPGDSGGPADCADAPVVTWASWGQGFLIESCQTCHATTSPDRNGAPEDVSFDTLDDVKLHADRMLVRATGDAPDMPPRGGISDDDRARLQTWLSCWLPEE